ncbi:unnamed protein product [Adineta steineri]|uniref:Uncharacterized protein n=1 Tax=Adineta steineri TaxID=433720 RepID=A0A818PZ91_9BILA|nr:unnamed protein product [Adineta steineri]CAF3633119.1 unnamed protein product [Adineta steineri]
MVFKTIWEWILSNGWPLSMNENIAIKYFNENHTESLKILTHFEISILANEIYKKILNLNIHEQLIIIDSDETYLTIPFILGILQSNNSFFICNSNWPENMLRNYIMQLNPSLFICQRQNKSKIYDQIFHHAMLSSIVLFNEQIDFYTRINNCNNYKDIAYIVASSGSTGIPKLIFVSHACILPNLNQLKSIFDVTSNDCLFRATSLTFDPSLIDIFLAIHCGACLVTLSKDIRQNSLSNSSISHCTIAQMTPSFFRQINTSCDLSHLKTLILGGEQFPDISNRTIQKMIKENKRVINIYGLTEMSCWASYYILNKNDLERIDGIPLGKVLDETSFVLKPFLDDKTKIDYFQLTLGSQTRWVQIGDLSLEKKFIFETDDLVRHDKANDQIYYIGRRTLTVKRFGIMINLEYIEQIAHQSNLLDECACLMLDDDDKNFLILLCKFKTENQINQLELFLKLHLIHHFLPNVILPLQINIPLSINGKIDRTKLYSIYLNTKQDSIDNNLINIWKKFVNKSPEKKSTFISDGGNSLIALTMIEQIKQSYSSINKEYLFNLLLHKSFEDLFEYINNPQQEQQQDKTIELFTPNLTNELIKNSNLNPIWSIQRCSKIFLHNNHVMSQYSTLPNESIVVANKLILNWKYSMNKCIDASPLIVILDQYRQYVIIGSHAGLINTYQINNGQLIWSFQTNDRIEASGTISRDGQFVLIGIYNGMLYIINCTNGKLYSSYQCQDLIKTIPCIHSSNDIVYLGAHDQFIHAIHIEENLSKCIWKYGLNSSCASSPQLSSDNEYLYVATLNGNIFAFKSNDGILLWKQSLNKPIFSTIVIWKDKFLLIGCVDEKLYCLSCDDGEQKWTFSTNGPIFSSPCLFNNTLFIGCHDQYLYAIDLSNEQQGILQWKCLFPSMVYASPFVFDNGQKIIIGSTNGCLRVLNSQTGGTICETQIDGNGLFSSPICYLDYIIVGSRDDYLYCYKLQS